jgi:hypothetical protein
MMVLRTRSILPIHAIAAGLALIYAGYVSQSEFVATGFQFVTPLIIIMVVHLCWLAVRGHLTRGFSQVIYLRSAQPAVGLAIVILLASIFAPQPAEAASAGDFVGGVLTVVFCVAIIAVIAGLIGLVIYIFAKAVSGVNNAIGGDDNNDPDSRLFDIGSLAVAGTFLCLASFEGVTSAMSFGPSNRSEATYLIEQTSDEVWTTLETATSPDFPLPNILELFP